MKRVIVFDGDTAQRRFELTLSSYIIACSQLQKSAWEDKKKQAEVLRALKAISKDKDEIPLDGLMPAAAQKLGHPEWAGCCPGCKRAMPADGATIKPRLVTGMVDRDLKDLPAALVLSQDAFNYLLERMKEANMNPDISDEFVDAVEAVVQAGNREWPDSTTSEEAVKTHLEEHKPKVAAPADEKKPEPELAAV